MTTSAPTQPAAIRKAREYAENLVRNTHGLKVELFASERSATVTVQVDHSRHANTMLAAIDSDFLVVSWGGLRGKFYGGTLYDGNGKRPVRTYADLRLHVAVMDRSWNRDSYPETSLREAAR